jgi:S1-C subfamily serine protease
MKILVTILFYLYSINAVYSQQSEKYKQNLPVSTNLTISKASVYNQNNEILNVFFIVNTATQSSGTGFLLKTGQVITNNHVVHGAQPSQIVLIAPTGLKYNLNKMLTDSVRDLAILFLFNNPTGGFDLGDDNAVLVGNQAYTWGFPLGYNGPSPLLSVGYIAGLTAFQSYPNKFVKHFVVNGAFNPGNSGGPLISSGKVIGIVQSKAAPITPYISSALQALRNNQSGVIYDSTDGSGQPIHYSEAQVIEQILEYFRGLAQVMIGEAVAISELKSFLIENNIKGF